MFGGCHLTDCDVVLVVLDEFLRYARGKTKPASTTHPSPPPSSSRPHTPPILTQPTPTPPFSFLLPFQPHTPPPPSPPPTPAVHTLRPPRNVGSGSTSQVVALFTNHHVWGNHNTQTLRIAKKTTLCEAQWCATINAILTQIF